MLLKNESNPSAGLLFPLSLSSNHEPEIRCGSCGFPGPNPAFATVVVFPEVCVLLSPLGVKWEKDEEAQKRIVAFAKTS